MRFNFIFTGLLFVLITFTGYGQVIRGKVVDRKSGKPVESAIVYINGTFLATYTDNNGQFELNVKDAVAMPVTVSSIGYLSQTIDDPQPGKALLVSLEPKVFELKEIVITASSKKRERINNLKLFREVFLGDTPNGKRCEILNENDIRFFYSPDGDTLRAYSAKPVLIKNKALGYTVTYYLDKFQYTVPDMLCDMTGNILFNEDISSKASDIRMFERRRISAYMGSRMHFYRALYAGKLKEEGFKINEPLSILNYKEATGVAPDTTGGSPPKFIIPKYKIGEKYWVDFERDYMGSVMILRDSYVIFKSNGYYSGSSVIWEGEAAKQRLGDWLPYEYIPGL